MEFILQNRSISNLNIQFNPDGWGPINGEKLVAFEDVPYAHFDKKEKTNRTADFVGNIFSRVFFILISNSTF
jgi:hypothetical protein